MFLVEFGTGWLAHSTALLADSLDMLGDALVYAFSPSVLGRGARWQARAALLKGTIMAAFGLGMAAEVIVKALRGVVPAAGVIGASASSPRPPSPSPDRPTRAPEALQLFRSRRVARD